MESQQPVNRIRIRFTHSSLNPNNNPSNPSMNPNRNNPKNPNPNTLLNLENSSKNPSTKHRLAMEKFREIVTKLANSDPNRELTVTQKSVIEKQLGVFLSDFHTPDHPPYAAMIHTAIKELNEKWGSSEESISQFLRRVYRDLPWAHSTLLKHHLGKLCDSGEIIVTRGQRYLLAGVRPDLYSRKKPTRQKLKRRRRLEWWKKQKRQKKNGSGEEIQGEEETEVVIGKQKECNGEGDVVTGKHSQTNGESGEAVEDQIQVRELPCEVTEQQEFSNPGAFTKLCGQQNTPESELTTKAASPIGCLNLDLLEQRQRAVVQNLERPSAMKAIKVEKLAPTAPQFEPNEQSQLSSLERPSELEPSREHSGHHHQEAAYEKSPCSSQAEAAIGSLGSTFKMSPLSESNQQPQLPNVDRPSDLEPSKEPSQQQQQQQAAAVEKSSRRVLRPRPPKPEPTPDARTMTSLPLQHCREVQQQQQQPERRGRGRPPKAKLEATTAVEPLLLCNYPHNPQQEEEQKIKPRRRGRPPKRRLETTLAEEVLTQEAV